MAPEADSLTRWLSENTVPEGDCLIYTGYLMPNKSKAGGRGYGQLPHTRTGPRWLAHKYVAHLTGKVGVIRHSCDNRPCCNPAHLIAGTQQENMVDKSMRSARTGTTLKLTPEQVLEVRRRMDTVESPTALAPHYGVTPENLMLIRARKTWTHLKDEP